MIGDQSSLGEVGAKQPLSHRGPMPLGRRESDQRWASKELVRPRGLEVTSVSAQVHTLIGESRVHRSGAFDRHLVLRRQDLVEGLVTRAGASGSSSKAWYVTSTSCSNRPMASFN